MSESASEPVAETAAAAALAERVVANLGSAVHATAETLRLPLLCLLAEGHLLVELGRLLAAARAGERLSDRARASLSVRSFQAR
jgi:hypothetical protein